MNTRSSILTVLYAAALSVRRRLLQQVADDEVELAPLDVLDRASRARELTDSIPFPAHSRP